MGIPIRPIFDHRSPEWPENERRYLDGFLRRQAIMRALIYGAALVCLLVLGIAVMVK